MTKSEAIEIVKISQIVKSYIAKINSFCNEKDHSEFERLLDKKYCKDTFNINYPFYKKVDLMTKKDNARFWSQTYIVRGVTVRITNHWFDECRIRFIQNLISKNIAIKEDFNEEALLALSKNLEKNKKDIVQNKMPANSRYKGYAIGKASNLLVRNILSNLGTEQFNNQDWEETKQYFKNRCVYCGEESKNLIMEHAVPINKKSLGEHRLGNIVPSCKECNNSKGSTSFVDFLSNDNIKIEAIKKYMDDKNYAPLGENEQIQMILNMAYNEVSSVSNRYIKILNGLIL